MSINDSFIVDMNLFTSINDSFKAVMNWGKLINEFYHSYNA